MPNHAKENVTAPRLCFTAGHYAALQQPAKSTFHQQLVAGVKQKADHYLREEEIDVDRTGHNWHLVRAFRMQIRLFTLLAQFKQNYDQKYFQAIWRDVERMANWEYWSWIAWRKGESAPDAIFDLSYGVNSLTLAFVYDALRDQWSESQQQLFVDVANGRSFPAYLKHTAPPNQVSWFDNPHSNWNTVCNGGAGVLALALRDKCPQSKEVIKRVEKGIKPFFKSTAPDGGWPEGVGYWNFGMRYGFLYLLSHETATGKTHPLLEFPGTAATLKFPLLFTPGNASCGFGDSNKFTPYPFHVLAARRLNLPEVEAELLERFQHQANESTFNQVHSKNYVKKIYTEDPELLILWQKPKAVAKRRSLWPSHQLIKGLDWGYMADSMPRPNIYISVRGGTIDMPHTHRDLLSFFCVVGGEKLIDNVPVDDYLDTTFSARRQELYEVSPLSKNTVFVNGAGIVEKSSVLTQAIEGRSYKGFRLDATLAMGSMRDGNAADFCGRIIVLLKNRAVVVIDEFELPFAGLVESRLHTFSKVSFRARAAQIRGEANNLHTSFACTTPSQLQKGMGLSTHPQRQPDTILRHQSTTKIKRAMMVSLLVPNGTGEVQIEEKDTTRKVLFEWEDAKGKAAMNLAIGARLMLD